MSKALLRLELELKIATEVASPREPTRPARLTFHQPQYSCGLANDG
jgi:hypothetical protein